MCPPSNKIDPSYWDLSFREREMYGSEEEKAKPGFDGAPSGVAHPSTKPNDLFHTGKMKNKPPCDAHKLVPSLPTYPPKETFRDCGTTRSQALTWEDIFAGAPTIGTAFLTQKSHLPAQLQSHQTKAESEGTDNVKKEDGYEVIEKTEVGDATEEDDLVVVDKVEGIEDDYVKV